MIRAKKVIAMTFAVAALILLATAIVSAIEGPSVMVTSYTVAPEPLRRGDSGTTTLPIKNTSITSESTTIATTQRKNGLP